MQGFKKKVFIFVRNPYFNPLFFTKMSQIDKLLTDVSVARTFYLDLVRTFSDEQAQWKSAPDVWNVVEITEHLFWAEYGGILGMWKTLHAQREGKMARQTASIHQNMPIEEIIALTWQPKEQVPAVAAPRMGGPIAFWVKSLESLQPLLETFAQELTEEDLRILAHPHPISGAMDFQQRLEFLRFHLDRHKQQVEEISQNFVF
jgi:DinB superfamily